MCSLEILKDVNQLSYNTINLLSNFVLLNIFSPCLIVYFLFPISRKTLFLTFFNHHFISLTSLTQRNPRSLQKSHLNSIPISYCSFSITAKRKQNHLKNHNKNPILHRLFPLKIKSLQKFPDVK